MSETSDRFRLLAGEFGDRARAVPVDGWDRPAPCDGWVARDVVRHMVEWMPGFFGGAIAVPPGPSVDVDPAGAWQHVADALQAALDDPAVAASEYENRAGRYTVEDGVAIFCIPDVLVHTWDLARATGLDETLDADEVHRAYVGLTSFDEEMLRGSGQFGARVDVPDDADEQTKLLAYSGRHP